MCLGVPLGYRAESARAVALRLCVLSLGCPQALPCLGPLVLHPPAAPETYSLQKVPQIDIPVWAVLCLHKGHSRTLWGRSRQWLSYWYIFLAVLGLGCRVWAFPSCGEQWLLCVVP